MIAGITLAAVSIPVALGYAKIAGMPVVTGLYTLLLPMAVFAWWLDGAVALGIAGWAVIEGRRAWAGQSCACACQPGGQCL